MYSALAGLTREKIIYITLSNATTTLPSPQKKSVKTDKTCKWIQYQMG
jgi:hypothetical protein